MTQDTRLKTQNVSISFVIPVKTGIGRILILGVGNILLKDEGVGVHVARKLQELALPCNVEVVDGGTASLDTLLLARDIEKLVVVDAFRAGKKPGTIYRIRLKAREICRASCDAIRNTKYEIRATRYALRNTKMSLHQVGLLDALAVAERINCAPKKVVVIGIEPGEVCPGLELTGPVKRSVPKVIKEVLKEIKKRISATKTQSHEGKK